MKTSKTATGAGLALAALATAWLFQQRRTNWLREQHDLEQKSLQQAVETFEGEGGLVPG